MKTVQEWQHMYGLCILTVLDYAYFNIYFDNKLKMIYTDLSRTGVVSDAVTTRGC